MTAPAILNLSHLLDQAARADGARSSIANLLQMPRGRWDWDTDTYSTLQTFVSIAGATTDSTEKALGVLKGYSSQFKNAVGTSRVPAAVSDQVKDTLYKIAGRNRLHSMLALHNETNAKLIASGEGLASESLTHEMQAISRQLSRIDSEISTGIDAFHGQIPQTLERAMEGVCNSLESGSWRAGQGLATVIKGLNVANSVFAVAGLGLSIWSVITAAESHDDADIAFASVGLTSSVLGMGAVIASSSALGVGAAIVGAFAMLGGLIKTLVDDARLIEEYRRHEREKYQGRQDSFAKEQQPFLGIAYNSFFKMVPDYGFGMQSSQDNPRTLNLNYRSGQQWERSGGDQNLKDFYEADAPVGNNTKGAYILVDSVFAHDVNGEHLHQQNLNINTTPCDDFLELKDVHSSSIQLNMGQGNNVLMISGLLRTAPNRLSVSMGNGFNTLDLLKAYVYQETVIENMRSVFYDANTGDFRMSVAGGSADASRSYNYLYPGATGYIHGVKQILLGNHETEVILPSGGDANNFFAHQFVIQDFVNTPLVHGNNNFSTYRLDLTQNVGQYLIWDTRTNRDRKMIGGDVGVFNNNRVILRVNNQDDDKKFYYDPMLERIYFDNTGFRHMTFAQPEALCRAVVSRDGSVYGSRSSFDIFLQFGSVENPSYKLLNYAMLPSAEKKWRFYTASQHRAPSERCPIDQVFTTIPQNRLTEQLMFIDLLKDGYHDFRGHIYDRSIFEPLIRKALQAGFTSHQFQDSWVKYSLIHGENFSQTPLIQAIIDSGMPEALKWDAISSAVSSAGH